MPLNYNYEAPAWGLTTRVRDVIWIQHPPENDDALLGIELEMEGTRVSPDIAERMRDWVGVRDGSLRGSSAEFVSRHPLSREAYPRALELLRDRLREARVVVTPSQRCSSHVHLNFANSTVAQAANFVFLWFLVEDFLVEHSGRERQGNNFCLRLRDAEDYLAEIIEAFQNTNFRHIADGRIRYAALNVASLVKYGTIEVRSFRGVADPVMVQPWIDLLLELYDLAHQFDTPLQIVGEFSGATPQGFISQRLPQIWRLIRNRRNLGDELYESVRRCQDLAYLIRWDHLPATAPDRAPQTNRDHHVIIDDFNLHGLVEHNPVHEDDDDDF